MIETIQWLEEAESLTLRMAVGKLPGKDSNEG